MPGPVEDYVKTEYHSAEFGSVWTANTVMPDGRLGMTEKKSHFEFQPTADGRSYEAVLAFRSYQHQDGHIVGVRDLEGRFKNRSMGRFETLDKAKEYASQFIADYKQTAREGHAYAIKHQQREDHYAVHGVYPKHEKKEEAVRGPRMRL